MKNFVRFLFVSLFFISAGAAKASVTGDKSNANNDSTVSLKSNIVIFKMITSPAPSSNGNGSLKKAGKVARTSNSSSIKISITPNTQG